MLAAFLALALQSAAPAAAAPTTPPAAAVAPATGSAPELDLAAPTADGLESLRQAYRNSCEARLYGEYDDMCSALADQVRQYRAALAKASRRPPAR